MIKNYRDAVTPEGIGVTKFYIGVWLGMSMCDKANKLVDEEMVTLETPIYFIVNSKNKKGEVNEYSVSIRPDGRLNCTCLWGSNFNVGSCCSHVLACFELLDRFKQRGNEKWKLRIEKEL